MRDNGTIGVRHPGLLATDGPVCAIFTIPSFTLQHFPISALTLPASVTVSCPECNMLWTTDTNDHAALPSVCAPCETSQLQRRLDSLPTMSAHDTDEKQFASSSPSPDRQAPSSLDELLRTLRDLPSDRPETDASTQIVPSSRKVSVHFFISDALRRHFARDWPGITFISNPNGGNHTHPRLAMDRRLCEDAVVARIPGHLSIVDIGGNASRHKSARRANVWSCCPLLDSTDAVRASNHASAGATRYCQHRFQDCGCITPDVYISIHSLYYLTPEDVLLALARASTGTMYAAVHFFDEAIGTFYDGEGMYRLYADGTVHMSTTGNLLTYKHSALNWLRSGHFANESGAMSWTILSSTSASHIYKFVRSPRFDTAIIDSITFIRAIKDNAYYGPVQLSGAVYNKHATALGTALTTVEFDVKSVFSWGSSLIAADMGMTKTYIIPKTLVNELALFVIGKHRTPAEYARLLGIARNRFPSYDLPPDIAVTSMILATTMAFVETADLELQALTTMNTTLYSRPWFSMSLSESLSHLIDGGVPWHIRYLFPSGCVASLLSVYFLYRYRSYFPPFVTRFFPQRVATPFSFAVGALSVLGLLCQVASFRNTVTAMQRGLAHYCSTHTSFVLSNAAIVSTTFTLPKLDVIKPLPALAIGAHVSPPKAPELVISGSAHLVGVGFTNAIPIVHASTINNQTLALAGRACVARHLGLPATKALFAEYSRRIRPELFPLREWTPIEPNYAEWNSHFPASQRKRHDAALYDLQANRVWIAQMNRLKMFVKVEKNLHSSPDAVKLGDPRPIMARQDVRNVATAPWIRAFSLQLRKRWCATSPFVVTFGLNATQLGAAFDLKDGASPFVIKRKSDVERADASTTVEMLLDTLDDYIHLGAPTSITDIQREDINKAGASNGGVVYNVVGTVASGTDDTMVGHTIRLTKVHLFVIASSNDALSWPLSRLVNEFQLSIFSVGDDTVLFHAPHMLYDPIHALGLGYVFETSICDAHTLEYCSGRFWPTTEGTIYAVKPGRVLAKQGYYIDLPEPHRRATHRAVLTQMMRDYSFLPPISAFCASQLSLLPDNTPGRVILPRAMRYVPHSTVNALPNSDTWLMLSTLYDWDEHRQREWVTFLLKLKSLPAMAYTPLIQKMLDVDADIPIPTQNSSGYSLSIASNIWTWFQNRLLHPANHVYDLRSHSSVPYRLLYFLAVFIGTPLWEEAFKRIHVLKVPVGFALLVGFETWLRGLNNVPWRINLACLIMHVVAYKLSYAWGFGVHLYWNYMAFLFPYPHH